MLSAKLFVVRAGMRGLSFTAPPLAAACAEALFRTPPRRRASEAELSVLATGRREDLPCGSRRIAVWSWGEGPTALLVHGWGSRGARLYSFLEPLRARGFSVVTFDAPGHGESPGRLSSLPQFIAAIETVARRFGPVDSVIAHSIGGAASALAMARGLAVRRAVFLAPAANPGEYSKRFAHALSVTPGIRREMERRLERRFGYRWEEFDAPRAVGALSTPLATPLLVFHDREDAEVPWSDGAAIAAAWPDARLVTTSALGHRRIVHEAAVVSEAAEFLAAGRASESVPGAARQRSL